MDGYKQCARKLTQSDGNLYLKLNLLNKRLVTMTYYAKIFFILFSCTAASVAAETLYKSVNEKGEITFSDSPPENAAQVQQIEVQPAPTEQQQREAMERERLIEEQASKLGASNAARAQSRATPESQEVPQVVEPVESYNTGNYYNRNPAPPQRPVQPLPGRPRPVPLPVTRPVQRPAR